jgi:CPA2 family monovalent cation:H+ antiporter-2
MISGLPLALTIAAIFIVGKMFSVGLGCYVANFKARSSFLVAASMVAMGEFTFVVAKIALDGKVIDSALYSSVIGASLVTMLLLPFLSKGAPGFFDRVVARMPKRLFLPLEKIEGVRMAAREKMRSSAELKREIRKQVLFIFIDFIIILTVLLAASFLSFFHDFAIDYSDDVNMLPALLLFIVELALTIPVVVNIVSRMRKIAELMAMAMIDKDEYLAISKTGTYKFFRNTGSAVALVILSVVIIQFFPGLEGLPPSWAFQIGIAVLIATWLAWDTIHSFYGKLSTSLSKGLTESPTDGMAGPGDMIVEEAGLKGKGSVPPGGH